MESINVVVLSGQIQSDAAFSKSGEIEVATFLVRSYCAVKEGDRKRRIAENHTVRLANPGSIAKYLKRGRPVMIQGRIVPDGENAYVMARAVNFPDRREFDE